MAEGTVVNTPFRVVYEDDRTEIRVVRQSDWTPVAWFDFSYDEPMAECAETLCHVLNTAFGG